MTRPGLRAPSRRGSLLWALGFLFVGGGAGLAGAEDVSKDAPVDYIKQVRPLLSRHCLACHGADPETRKAGLRLDRREAATTELESGSTAIVPGDPEASDLIFRIAETDDSVRMPPPKSGPPLSPEDVEVLTRWVKQGATYTEHWAFVPPRAVELPAVKAEAWPRSGIDRWILARLEAEGLTPEAEADPHILLRRASLDLRGLPPTPEELKRFLDDREPGAYERAVDRFLDDPAFGERWARMWLDLARYADSAGYGSDPLRPNMWRYRDWVIDAFNRNLPYDRFTVEQLAGDLLPDPTLEQKVATAFHRNTMTNTEGGTDDEEFRVAAIKDRVSTTGQVWMGLTVGCAQCHTHKYDPISNEEYYRLYAVFNQTADSDQPDETPTLPAPTSTQAEEIRRIDSEIAALRTTLDTATPELASSQERWEASLAMKGQWTPLEPVAAKSEAGATLEVESEGSIRATGTSTTPDTYSIEARSTAAAITALRLETIPDPSLPAGGAGRAPDGNFVLSRVSASVEPDGPMPAAPSGSIVRVELPGSERMLSLAEVEVWSGGENRAPTGTAAQSSTDFDGPAPRAIDGNTNGHYFDAKSTTHTRAEANPWWEVTLPEPVPVERIVVWNRTDGGAGNRLNDFRVKLLDAERKVVWESEVAEPPAPSRELALGGPRPIKLERAFADFSQDGFPVASLLADKLDPAKGWAVAPQQSQPHQATFTLARPLDPSGPVRWTVRLEHRYKDTGYALGRFRLAVSDDPAAPRRSELPPAILAIVDKPADTRTPEERDALARHFRSVAPELQPIRDQIATLEKAKPEVVNVPVMAELPAEKRRETHLLNKGNFLDPGPVVTPGLLAAFTTGTEPSSPDRLALARWLVDPKNPLTARVAVNRFWAQLFGIGIVETEEDFGTQGDLPSHPELLDWLAIEFVNSGWDMKAMIRQMVTSATYRQSSRTTPEKLAKDPRNRLLSHAPRYRLDAETVRDQALALSGLLSRRVGGPSVFPPQPDGLWQAAFNGQRTWSTSKGNDSHRRGLYTFWRRTVPYPSMATFDAPSREICTLRRIRTNTPLQAFVTLNDPVYVETAQALARRIASEGGSTVEDRVRFALELCLCRPPEDRQVQVLADLYARALEQHRRDPEAARALATEPLGPLPAGMDPAELAAWTTVANVLLNLDGVLTRG